VVPTTGLGKQSTHSGPSLDFRKPKENPGVVDNIKGRTGPPHGARPGMQCRRFRRRLGAPTTAKRPAKVSKLVLAWEHPSTVLLTGFPSPPPPLLLATSRQYMPHVGATPAAARKGVCCECPAYYLSGWPANSFASLRNFVRGFRASMMTLRCVGFPFIHDA